MLQGKRIQIRLCSRTNLTATKRNHIILEMLVINTTHISLHSTSMSIHTHKTCTQEMFIVYYGIHRSHNRVNITAISENTHFNRCVERFSDFLLCSASFLQSPITICLPHGTGNILLNIFFRCCRAIRSIGLRFIFFIESNLQIIHQMFINSFFCIFLHPSINRCIDTKAISINIIILTVTLFVFVTPTIKRIIFPSNRIDIKLSLVPLEIIFAIRFSSHHITA